MADPIPPRGSPAALGRSDQTWQQRLEFVIATMRELSRQSDPNSMVVTYSRRMQSIVRIDGTHALSRRGLEYPFFRMTRSSLWKENIDPWKQRDKLPLLKGGLLAELIYGDVPRLIDPLEYAADDPAAEYFAGMGSLIAIPHYEDGVGLNMVFHTRRDRGGFDPEGFPDFVQSSNLFGRTTKNLLLAAQLREANTALDRELKSVGEVQHALLPQASPDIATLDIARYYQTSTVAGGDYYDFFKLANGKWGILIADVSGHGAPAAVLMAIVHAIAHLMPGDPLPPERVMEFINDELVQRYTSLLGAFVTAFYGVYDDTTRRLTYACAGHPAPLIRRADACGPGSVTALDMQCAGIPLGIQSGVTYEQQERTLVAGEVLMMYTDGITEAFGPAGDMYGEARLTGVLQSCHPSVEAAKDAVVADLAAFCGDRPVSDDRTLLVVAVK